MKYGLVILLALSEVDNYEVITFFRKRSFMCICKFEDLVEKRKSVVAFDTAEDYWKNFYKRYEQTE